MHDTPSPRRLRLRAALDKWFLAVVIILVALLVLGGVLAYLGVADDGTATLERDRDLGTVNTQYSHSATVTETNPVFARGSQLSGRTTYFQTITPDLDVTSTTSIATNAAADLQADVESRLVLAGRSDGSVLWETQEGLDGTSTTLTDDGTVDVSFTLSMDDIVDELDAIEDSLGGAGDAEARIDTTVQVNGDIDGETVRYDDTVTLDIDPGGTTYTVTDPGPVSDAFTVTETALVDADGGLTRLLAGVLALGIGVFGLGAVALARRRGVLGLTPAERRYLRYLEDRREFDEWINHIRLPDSAMDRPVAEADSLRDLVDFAIDNDTGVIENPGTDAYHVLAEGYRYTFVPPHPAEGDAEGGPDELDLAPTPEEQLATEGQLHDTALEAPLSVSVDVAGQAEDAPDDVIDVTLEVANHETDGEVRNRGELTLDVVDDRASFTIGDPDDFLADFTLQPIMVEEGAYLDDVDDIDTLTVETATGVEVTGITVRPPSEDADDA